MSGFSAVEAEFLLNASFAFFRGEFGAFDGIHDHGVRIMVFGGQDSGERVVCLVRHLGVPLGYVVSSLPLSLEGNGFLVPVIYGGGDSAHGHDLTHERRGNSCREVSDQDVGITNIGESDLILEGRDIFYMGGGVHIVLVLSHSFGG